MDSSLLACFEQNQLPAFNGTYVLLGAAALLFVLLLAGFAFLLLRRNQDWVQSRYTPLDSWLSAQRHTARPWRIFKSRFSRSSWYGIRLTLAVLIIFAMLSLFEEIFEGWADEETLLRIDQATHCALTGFTTGPVLDAILFLTSFADVLVMLVVSSALFLALLYFGQKRHALALFLAMGVGQAVVWGLKWLSSRPRPEQQLTEAAGQSFPSAHAFAAIIFYGFLIFLIWQWTSSRAIRALATIALSILIIAIGISRLLLSVHWVSDVLGGFVIGLAWLLFSLIAARSYFAYRER